MEQENSPVTEQHAAHDQKKGFLRGVRRKVKEMLIPGYKTKLRARTAHPTAAGGIAKTPKTPTRRASVELRRPRMPLEEVPALNLGPETQTSRRRNEQASAAPVTRYEIPRNRTAPIIKSSDDTATNLLGSLSFVEPDCPFGTAESKDAAAYGEMLVTLALNQKKQPQSARCTYDKAIRVLAPLARTHPGSWARCLIGLGTLLRDNGNLEGAKFQFQRAVRALESSSAHGGQVRAAKALLTELPRYRDVEPNKTLTPNLTRRKTDNVLIY